MKKLFLLIFFLIPMPVFAENIAPTKVYFSLYHDQQIERNLISSVEYGSLFYHAAYEYISEPSATKVTFRYDFSQNNNEYLTFMVHGFDDSITVDLDGNRCQTLTTSLGVNYSFVCKNSKKSTSYLNIFQNKYSGSDLSKYMINADVGGYNDSVTAAISSQTQLQQQQNQIINNTDTSSNSTDFANTINNFTMPNDSHAFDILGGLQSFVGGLSVSSSCRRITIPIPFTNQTLTLPCMTTDVYSVHFPEIVVIWQLLVRGLVYYYIIVNILRLIKETIDPFNFKLEVLDL